MSTLQFVRTVPGRTNQLRQSRASAVYPYLLVWFLAGCMALYLKWEMLAHGGFRCVGRALGRAELTDGPASRAYLFSLLERLSFFRGDLLLLFVVVPLVGSLVLYWLGRRWRMALVAAATSMTLCFLFLQIHGYWFVGQFQSWQLWSDAMHWAVIHPGDVGTYGGKASIAKLVAALVLPAAMGFALLWLQGQAASGRGRATWLAGSLGVLVCALTVAAWSAPLAATAYHRSMIGMCLRAFLSIEDTDVAKYNGLSGQDVMARWRDATGTPAPKANPSFFGSARDYDVIFFVLETAPARCLDITGPLEDMPNLRRLRQRAWVAPHHLSTYPYTSCALFSLTTSWYPTSLNYFDHGDKRAPGLMRSLRDRGYVTAAYKPFAENAENETRQYAEGISTIYHAQGEALPCDQPFSIPWHKVIQRDEEAMAHLKMDITGWAARDHRYAVMFLPQLGHGVWPDIISDGKSHDMASRGKALVAYQDKYLGELVATLEQTGRLDRTIIAFVGDHGIRTKMEDPAFEGGLIDPYSYHVPFLLYAPGVLKGPATIGWTTSHIDVGPSILNLLGVSQGRDYELGGLLWDARLAQRTVFMWGKAYLGADGFCDKGNYGMWQNVSDMAFSNSTFNFKDSRPLPAGSPQRQRVIDRIGDITALQYRITRLGSGEG